MNFKEWLANQMKEREWSQSELAKRANIDPQVISDYVNGEREKPDYSDLIAITSALELTPEIVFQADGLSLSISPADEFALSLLDDVNHLDEIDKQGLKDYVDFLIAKMESEKEEERTGKRKGLLSVFGLSIKKVKRNKEKTG